MSARLDRRESAVRALGEQVQELGWTTERIGHVYAEGQGLHPTDFRALTAIYRAELVGEPLTARGLAASLDLQPSTISYVVDRLVGSGHVTRERDPLDARQVILRYAQEGLNVAGRFFGPLAVVHAEALAGFSHVEILTAERVLAVLVQALKGFEHGLRRD